MYPPSPTNVRQGKCTLLQRIRHSHLRVALLLLASLYIIALEAQNFDPFNQGDLSDEEYATASQNYLQEIYTSAEERLYDPCEITVRTHPEILRFSSFSLFKVQNNQPDLLVSVVDESGAVLYYGRLKMEHPIKVPNDRKYSVLAANPCSATTELFTFDTRARYVTDPYRASELEYRAIRDFQKGALSLPHSLEANTQLSAFTKNRLLQTYMFRSTALPDRLADRATRELLDKPDFPRVVDKSGQDCNCVATERSINYTMRPIQRIRSDGRISGMWSGNHDQRFNSARVLASHFSYTEGPARLQDMHVRTVRCINDADTYSWNGDNQVIELNAGTGDMRDVRPADFTAENEWNLVCTRGEDGFRLNDWDCERDVHFAWDYQSIVQTQGDIITGGWCGSRRRALSVAFDVAVASVSEPDPTDPNGRRSYRPLNVLLNGRTSECNQTYIGPTVEEFGLFIFDAVEFANEDEPDREDLAELLRFIDERLLTDWLLRTGCSQDLRGQTRSMSEGRLLQTYSTKLRPNQFTRLTLSASSFMQAAGRRRWDARSRIGTSFYLTSILEGGMTREQSTTSCCTPEAFTWMLANVASREANMPQAANERSYQRAVASHLNIHGSIDPNVWTETKHDDGYPNQRCPNNITVRYVSPLNEDGPEDSRFRSKADAGGLAIYATDPTADYYGETATLYDVNGRLLAQKTFDSYNSVFIRGDNLPCGVYFLRVQLTDEITETHKIIHTR